MNKQNNSEGEALNPIDAFFLNQDQKGELAKTESVEEGVFDVKADDLLHAPNDTSQEHSLDDTHETLTKPRFDTNDLLNEAETATEKNEQD